MGCSSTKADMFSKKIGWLSGTRAAVLAVALLVSFSEARADVDLTGTWYRSPKESDDAESEIRDAAKRMFDKATKGGRNVLSEDILQIQRRLQSVISSYLQFADSLEIEQTSRELHIDDGEGRIRIFYLDGEKHVRQTPHGETLETVCTRGSNHIIIEQKLDRGGTIVENYVPSPDGNRMVLTVRFETKQLDPPLVLRNVYDREP
jgi:hypothetical protein